VAASLKLPITPSLGFAYILPYNCKSGNTWVKKAQFQLGYKGLIQLAARSGEIVKLNVTDVREGEIANYDRLSGDIDFNWGNDAQRNELKITGYVAYMKLKNGFDKFHFMTVADIQAHAGKYSQSYKKGYGVWKDEFDAMASKTVLKLLLSKYAPMTPTLARAVEADQGVIEGEKITYPDNQKLSAPEQAAQIEQERIVKHIEEAKTLEELEKCQLAINPETDGDLFEQYMCKKELLEKKDQKENKNAK
jgi:recombination protein RecT